MNKGNIRKETLLVHEGYETSEHKGSLAVPLYQTSTFAFDSAEQGQRRFAGEGEILR